MFVSRKILLDRLQWWVFSLQIHIFGLEIKTLIRHVCFYQRLVRIRTQDRLFWGLFCWTTDFGSRVRVPESNCPEKGANTAILGRQFRCFFRDSFVMTQMVQDKWELWRQRHTSTLQRCGTGVWDSQQLRKSHVCRGKACLILVCHCVVIACLCLSLCDRRDLDVRVSTRRTKEKFTAALVPR